MTTSTGCFALVAILVLVPMAPPLAAQQESAASRGYGGLMGSIMAGWADAEFDDPERTVPGGRERMYAVRLGPRLNAWELSGVVALAMSATYLGGIREGDRYALGNVGAEAEIASRHAWGWFRPHVRAGIGGHTSELFEGDRVLNLSGRGTTVGAGAIVNPLRRPPALRAQGGLDVTLTWMSASFDTAEFRRAEHPREIDYQSWRATIGLTGPFDLMLRR
jgi:hypothetical protein